MHVQPCIAHVHVCIHTGMQKLFSVILNVHLHLMYTLVITVVAQFEIFRELSLGLSLSLVVHYYDAGVHALSLDRVSFRGEALGYPPPLPPKC